MTAKEIVKELDKFIIGQEEAKRAVAIALKNRERRLKADSSIRDEISPKNIIMAGPTGVGKTEIARRLAKIVDAPFVKVEATKFTEVGYVGRDVDSMIRDLVEEAVRIVKSARKKKIEDKAIAAANSRIADILLKKDTPDETPSDEQYAQMMEKAIQPFLFRLKNENSGNNNSGEQKEAVAITSDEKEKLLQEIREGVHDEEPVEIMVQQHTQTDGNVIALGLEMRDGDLLESILPKPHKKKKVTVKEARKIFAEEEAEKLIDMDDCAAEAIELAEQSGIVFIDEIDKIASSGSFGNHDVSRDGVQRDILPIVEGSSIRTKYGTVRTDHMLFIAAGAFHVSSVSDLMPELQGRFPIRVELSSLKASDYRLILTQPQNAVIKQYKALLETDNVYIDFTDDALDYIAECAEIYNGSHENIGARRIHMLLEMILSDILFEAGENGDNIMSISIDKEYVKMRLNSTIGSQNPDKYIV